MMEEGRCLLDLQRAHPRKGYRHFGGHETKFRPDLRPSDGKLEKGREISYPADEIQGGPLCGSMASRSHKHQMGYNRLGSILAAKDPGLYLMRSGTDCGNKRQRVDCSVVLEMAHKESSPDRGVKYRSPLGLSVLVSVQWFGSSKGDFGCRWIWFKYRGIPARKFPILFLLSAENDFHSVPNTASLPLLIFHVEPGINIVSTPFSEKSANCICVSLEDTGSSAAFSFRETWSDGATLTGCDQKPARRRKIHSLSDLSDGSIL